MPFYHDPKRGEYDPFRKEVTECHSTEEAPTQQQQRPSLPGFTHDPCGTESGIGGRQGDTNCSHAVTHNLRQTKTAWQRDCVDCGAMINEKDPF